MDNPARKTSSRLAVYLVSLPIRGYRYFISPLLGSNCRFYPSCSSYCLQALSEQGLLRGGYLSIKRLLKCHPWHAGGIDPVPANPCDHRDPHLHRDTPNHQHSGTTT